MDLFSQLWYHYLIFYVLYLSVSGEEAKLEGESEQRLFVSSRLQVGL